jgi:hypothetical protein
MVDLGAQGVVFLRPLDSSVRVNLLAIFRNRRGGSFFASGNPGRVSSASTRVPFCFL